MPIELTTAPLSSINGINSSLSRSITFGLPQAENFTPAGVAIRWDQALEGASVPNEGFGTTYTKTYNLSATIPSAYVVMRGGSEGMVNQENTNIYLRNLLLRTTLMAPLSFTPDTMNVGMFVTQDYTQAINFLIGGNFATRDELGRTWSSNQTIFKTYAQLFGTLFGYYVAPGSFGVMQPNAKSMLKSAYISGTNLVMDFQKATTTSGISFNNEQFCVLW